MMHPFDDTGLTFRDLKTMVTAGLSGNLTFTEAPSEKTDGQNLFATIQNGEVKFARNKTELKTPMTLSQFKDKFKDHPSQLVRDTFQFAADDLASQLIKLPKSAQAEYFRDGLDFMNMELIYSLNPNVIHYDTNVIQFHGIKETDGQGNITGDSRDPAAARTLAKMLQRVNADLGKTFRIIPPKIIQLMKDVNFAENAARFIKQIDGLRNRYRLGDSDTISKYNEMWWREEIDRNFPGLDDQVKEGLVLRWAYDDKKTLDMRALAKLVDPATLTAIKRFDQGDVKLKYKENVEPFEDIFLEVGSIVLKNATDFLAASPERESQRLRTEIMQAADNIRKTGSADQVTKVSRELKRLEKIGGIDAVLPTEGIVFKYGGKVYKLTGAFAAINQLLGAIKYGR